MPRPRAVPPPARPTRTESWVPTRALGRAVLVVGLLLFVAVLLGRVDLVVLATPFAVGAALGMWRRPRALPVVAVHAAEEMLSEGRELSATVTVGNPDPVGFDLVVLRTTASPYLRLRRLDRPYVMAVGAGESQG
ncbi:MAG TPA: DUF58 domain-containing protein, partial [Rugosimonospora sp.]|nr:DUF58 domain-containing protein [Rugosimonospora sp.]